MPKFEACSRIRKRLVTIWIFPYICFDLRCAGETQQRNVWKILVVTRRFRIYLFITYLYRDAQFSWAGLNGALYKITYKQKL